MSGCRKIDNLKSTFSAFRASIVDLCVSGVPSLWNVDMSLRNRLFGRVDGGDVNASPASDGDDTRDYSTPAEVIVGKDHISSTATDYSEKEPGSKNEAQESINDVDLGRDDETDPEISEIPPDIRKMISLHDDPTLPTITFRYFILTILFIAPGAFLSQMSIYRTTNAPYSVFFVQIAANYVGLWLAKVLPAWIIKVPFTKYSFSLNPGPWSIKEHVLVTLSAASGAMSNLGYTPITMSELYFGETINPAAAIFFMWAIVWTGYSFAAIARQFLLYDPVFPWYKALCQTNLFETQRKNNETPTPLARRQMTIFFLALIGVILWQFLPEFVFPMLGSLAFLCWVAPRNAAANFVGAGFGGMGFLNLSLDWSSIEGGMVELFLAPWWTQVLCFLGYAIPCWILLPAAKFGGMGEWHHGLMSNRLFLANGTKYPITELLTPQATLNETAYQENGPMYVGVQQLYSLFFDYASYTSAYVWMILFGYSRIKDTFKKMKVRSQGKAQSVNHLYTDRLNVIQRAYQEVPIWWYIVLFMSSFVILITIFAKGIMFIPIWTYFVALATGAVAVTPMAWLYAISNFQVEIGSFNELLYGYMVNSVSGHKNPSGASTYGAIAGDAWYRAQSMLQDQKIGHYMHIPPRDVFFSQIFGTIIGVPINYGVVRWIIDTKGDYLTGAKEDPTHQWTGQTLASSLTMGVQYVLVGPKRLFELEIYHPLPYSFLVGAGAPVIMFALHKAFPRMRFDLWNTTILFSGFAWFYGNISTGYTSSFIGGFVVMFWAYRYRNELWSRYNYLLAAAFDAGFNFNMLLIFLMFGSGKMISMPNWWGNNAKSSERCFALDTDS
ncbi:MAG: hypothetical protein M1819_006828 [Sarea resinae]|nr:MAG: hypothetical protein M1819_006828 [Sarea resinae]